MHGIKWSINHKKQAFKIAQKCRAQISPCITCKLIPTTPLEHYPILSPCITALYMLMRRMKEYRKVNRRENVNEKRIKAIGSGIGLFLSSGHYTQNHYKVNFEDII